MSVIGFDDRDRVRRGGVATNPDGKRPQPPQEKRRVLLNARCPRCMKLVGKMAIISDAFGFEVRCQRCSFDVTEANCRHDGQGKKATL